MRQGVKDRMAEALGKGGISFSKHGDAWAVESDSKEVRAALARILASSCFAQAKRASDFLRFAVEQTLAGAGPRLKGQWIAIEVFGRSADFDSQRDPLVRVEAGRLRRRLAQYYSGEGAGDPIRIQLPRGSYAVTWVHHPLPQEPPSAAPVVERRGPRASWRLATAAIGVVVVAAAGLIPSQQLALPGASAAGELLVEPERTEWPRFVVVPFENLTPEPKLATLVAIVTDEVMLALDQLDLYVVAGQARGSAPVSASPGSYLLTGSVRGDGGQARLTARLVDAETGQQLWTSIYSEHEATQQLLPLQELVARDVAALAAPYGPIFEAELRRVRERHAPELRDCVAKYYDYRRRIDPGAHADALECFEHVSARKPRVAQVWAGQALLHLDSYAFHFGDDATASLTAARDATARAIAIDADDFLANMALMRVLFFDGDPRFRDGIEKTLALRANSAEALSQAGIMLTMSGDSAAGLPLIERARALSNKPPGVYYNVAFAVTYLRAGQFERALDATLKVRTPDWVGAQTLLTAAAALAGRDDVAREAAARLVALYPAFEAEALNDFDKWHYDGAYQEKLIAGLEAAGLKIVGASHRGSGSSSSL
jgi:TolB-like protein